MGKQRPLMVNSGRGNEQIKIADELPCLPKLTAQAGKPFHHEFV
jgi:hypothetical protein